MNIAFFVLLAALIGWTSPVLGQQANPKIVITFTGGHKGFLEPIHGKGGLARVATTLKQIKAEADKNGHPFLALDSGNTISPFFYSRFNQGKVILKTLRGLGYQAMTPGNQEFAYGQNYFLALSKSEKMPLICANIYKGKDRAMTPYVIKELKGIKVGIFGLTSPKISEDISNHLLEGLAIKKPTEEAPKIIAELKKQGCQVIICLGFLSLNQSYQVANKNRDIDLVVRNYRNQLPPGGTQIFRFDAQQQRAIVVAPEEAQKSVGVATLEFKTSSDKKYTLSQVSVRHITLDKQVKLDPKITEDINQLKEQIESRVGADVFPYPPSEVIPTKLEPKAFAEFLGHILRQQLNTEIAIINLGLFEEKELANLVKKKTLKYKHLELVFRARSNLARIGLKGADILSIFNNPNPDEPLAFSGIKKEKDGVKIHGVPVNPGHVYWVATNQFLASGTTGYGQFKNKVSMNTRFLIKDHEVQNAPENGLNLAVQEAFSAYATRVLDGLGYAGKKSPYFSAMKSAFVETLEYEPAYYMFVFDNLRLTYSQTNANVRSQLGNIVSDSRASAKNEAETTFAGKFKFIRLTRDWLLENTVGFIYAQSKTEGGERNTSEDDLYFQSQSTFLMWGFDMFSPNFHFIPYFNAKYDTEFEEEDNAELQKELFLSLGFSRLGSDFFKKIRLGGVVKATFRDDISDTFQFGIEGEVVAAKTFFSFVTYETNLLVYYFPDQSQSRIGDLRIRAEWGNLIKVPFFQDFNFVLEFRLFAFQENETEKGGYHTVVTLGISYNRAWKFMYENFIR